MAERSEFSSFKWSSAFLTTVSIILIALRLINRPILRFDFEFLLFHIPALLSVLFYIYLAFKGKFD
ncbi:MAG: hypothetical protein DRJ26_04070 [Candidatus Methanomethylicota archaeon]|uniref:Uncharacterized protein n=1 Tax=Thermoproteota archaeon TaxID=2056631 RepID=A0A497F0V7_9CREN|nr:MAG: hypothetical protein DRJ26_04070 [Candidatus Verstraetearchaeota archaeon]